MFEADDERAGFEEFVAARRTALLRTAYLLVGDHADAEDLVQQALIKAVPHWRRIAARPEAYVRRILVRESISAWRSRRWRETATGRLPDVPHPRTDVEAHLSLHDALDRLAPRQRAVLVLRYFDDLTERDTASALGVSVGTVKSNARDAVARLRLLLDEDVLTEA